MGTEQFINSLIPGNYFLTKSMELSKIKTSGTLWYTKKFIVYYNQIFLSDNISTKEDVEKIINIFNAYIESLPENNRDEATNFFYSSHETADLRNANFRLFDDFAGNIVFQNTEERNNYYQIAKKYYFAFLMESGGQSGVKEHIKNNLYKENFCFSMIDGIIQDYYRNTPFNLSQIKNDYMAFLRNERQVLFYYGFFHSKSSGSNEKEFSSLTPVGELALKSNFYEFLALWEHQKIKMISQPVTIDIKNIEGKKEYDPNNFKINIIPYLTILQWLKIRKEFTNDEYQYIISRLESPIDKVEINKLIKNIGLIIRKVESFERKADIESEDFQKELKKYLLGIRNDFNYDNNNNPLNICNLNRSTVNLIDENKLKRLVDLYSKLTEYKKTKYSDLFEKCNYEMQCKYRDGIKGEKYKIDGKIKIEWDIYNIHIDLPILLSTMFFVIQNTDNIQFNTKNISCYVKSLKNKMPNAIDFIGLSSDKSLKKELQTLNNAIETGNFEKYITKEHENYELLVKKYQSETSEGLLEKIKEESNKPIMFIDGVKKRNKTLIHLIKAYNSQNNLNLGAMNCECCGEPSFITSKEETYLEYHHLIPFSDYDGPDHFLNLYALCPSCHRKLHYINLPEKRNLYTQLSDNNYMHITIEQRLKDLFLEKKLRSYHMEFLLADNAITEIEYNSIIQTA